jgi:hypothetical protein
MQLRSGIARDWASKLGLHLIVVNLLTLLDCKSLDIAIESLAFVIMVSAIIMKVCILKGSQENLNVKISLLSCGRERSLCCIPGGKGLQVLEFFAIGMVCPKG